MISREFLFITNITVAVVSLKKVMIKKKSFVIDLLLQETLILSICALAIMFSLKKD